MNKETDRLILRSVEISDFESIYHLRSDEKINQFVKRNDIQTRDVVRSFLEKTIARMEKQEVFDWVICLKSNPNQVIGSICLWNLSPDRSKAELGYALMNAFQGKGIMSEAVSAVVEFGFMELFLDKIEAFTSQFNGKSIQLLERKGFLLAPDRKDEGNSDNRIFEIYRQ